VGIPQTSRRLLLQDRIVNFVNKSCNQKEVFFIADEKGGHKQADPYMHILKIPFTGCAQSLHIFNRDPAGFKVALSKNNISSFSEFLSCFKRM
jgi:hypothetical protein